MSAITLVNSINPSDSSTAEFRLYQGANQIARIGVHTTGRASIPTTSNYSAQAMTSMGEFSLTSNTVTFSSDAVDLLAQVLTENGYYDFQLVAKSGSRPDAITCENTWRRPVQFTLTKPGTPIQIVTVVDEHNDALISTAQQWQCYAIVNGITTSTVTINDPNGTVTLVSDNNDDAFTLVVS